MEPSRIIQLDDSTIGHIAAGEVVERPAQVVKELIENSVDAGCKAIEVKIENGGYSLIEVQDDGSGIHPDDLPLAFDRHATSKLRTAEDLNTIHTLGFRGEAIASIGMVSELTIQSRIEGSSGNSITMFFGEKGTLSPIGMKFGTLIIVKDLFKNVPARLAFQRKASTENSRIVEIITSNALANPSISYTLSIDGRTSLKVNHNEDYQDRLFDLLGAQANSLIKLQISNEDSMVPGEEKWSGWISTPDITRGKGDEVHILINSRPVASGPFQSAIRRGYKTRLMVGRHPVAVLNLELPPSEVDVNVHPTKREVRLKNAWRILEKLERAIAFTLETVPTTPEAAGGISGIESLGKTQVQMELPREPTIPESDLDEPKPAKGIQDAIGIEIKPLSAPKIADSGKKETSPNWLAAAQTEIKKQSKPRPVSESPTLQKTLTGTDAISPALSSAERELHRYSEHEGVSPEKETKLGGLLNELGKLEPLAQFADSYILVQADEELLLVDQHALHERIRYERLRNDQDNWQSQKKLTPIPIALNPMQAEKIISNQEALEKIGFEIKMSGDNQWSIFAAPKFLKNEDLIPFVNDLIQDLGNESGRIDTVERKKDYVAFMKSCKGAVKANQKLTLPEMRRLLEDMRRIPNPWACVHGRPTAMRISLHNIDEHFGRHG